MVVSLISYFRRRYVFSPCPLRLLADPPGVDKSSGNSPNTGLPHSPSRITTRAIHTPTTLHRRPWSRTRSGAITSTGTSRRRRHRRINRAWRGSMVRLNLRRARRGSRGTSMGMSGSKRERRSGWQDRRLHLGTTWARVSRTGCGSSNARRGTQLIGDDVQLRTILETPPGTHPRQVNPCRGSDRQVALCEE